MASASSGIGSFVGGSAFDPASQPRQNTSLLIAVAVAAVLVVLIALKKR